MGLHSEFFQIPIICTQFSVKIKERQSYWIHLPLLSPVPGVSKSLCPQSVELFTTQSGFLMPVGKNPFENIVGKGENAGNQHFSFSHNVFSTIKYKNHHYS